MNNRLAPATRVAQALRIIDERTGAVVPGIEPASTFMRDEDYQPRQSYIYGRDGGPTVEHAEAVIASLDGAASSMLFASGLSAVTAVMETLKSGDHVVATRIMYHGVINWLVRLRERRGIEVTFFDPSVAGSLEAALRPGKTRLVWIETPTNPNWDVVDIRQCGRAARDAGAIFVVDSTVAPACTTQALTIGADIVFQSATKYLAGHSDLTAGALSIRETSPLWDEIRQIRTLQGSVIAAFEAWLLIRGMRTLFLRFDRASANAMTLARHFEKHPKLQSVLYPGLPSHPGHAIAASQMTGGFGGMLSLLTRTEAQARNVARFVQVFIPATSLGGVESLIEHRKAVEGPNSVVPAELLRISAGIEDVADLIADLEQALDRGVNIASTSQSATDPDFVQNPYPFYERARTLGPLFYWQEFGLTCATGYDTVNAVLRDRRFGREAPPGFGPVHAEHVRPFYDIDQLSMLSREPPAHTRLRGLVLKAFTSRRIASLAPDIVGLAHELVDGFHGDRIDLLPEFAEKLPVIIIARLLGVDESCWRDLLGWSHDMVGMYQAKRDRAMEDRAVRATLEFSDFLQRTIEQKRRNPRDDLISSLIAARDAGDRLSDMELISSCILLLNAGHEATVHTIGNGVKAMLEAGESRRIDDAVVEEILRFDPPLHLFTRYALEPIDLAGHRFAIGDEIGLLLAAANRDPARYADPQVFDPVRGGVGQLSFGAGLHFCVGAPLARMELLLALPILFARVPQLALADRPAYANLYHFHGLQNLNVALI